MGLSLGGLVGGIVGQSKKYNLPNTPSYYEDPNFADVQSFLKTYGQDMLNGKMPDYYKAIGDPASSSLLGDYVSDATRDIVNNDLEAGALTGRGRTGLSSNALNQVGNISGALRYQDYTRAMQGRQSLLNTGLGVEDSVRSSAFANMGDKNSFNQWKFSQDLNNEILRNSMANRKQAEKGALWSGGIDMVAPTLQTFINGQNSSPSLSQIVDTYGGGRSSALNPSVSNPTIPSDGTLTMKNSGGFDLQAALAKILPLLMGA